VDSTGLIVIGSGPAGVSAAEAFRQLNSDDPVRILTDDPALPYERPPLSKEFLRGEADIADTELHPGRWYDEQAIELIHTAGGVQAIDVAGQYVVANEQHYPYRSLVLACGAKPSRFPVPGGERALQLRSLGDAKSLRSAAAEADSAVVIGAGFIGCEAAASLAMRGVSTTLVAPDPVPQGKRLGEDAGQRIVGLLREVGVRYTGSVSVSSLSDGAVHLDNGVTIDCDLVLAATGVTPRSALAGGAGIDTSESRITVDAQMRTSVENIFAAGDVALAYNSLAGRPVAVEHWQDALDQGEIAGAGAAGHAREWDAVPGFWTTIGESTLKYHAWGDGFDRARLVEHDDGFTVWYEADGATVGVLTYNVDDDYDRGEDLIRRKSPIPL
jgi:3-phenylpropionate/trans-cinnamate dioxygenase ferredoxin reductase component